MTLSISRKSPKKKSKKSISRKSGNSAMNLPGTIIDITMRLGGNRQGGMEITIITRDIDNIECSVRNFTCNIVL
jgi:hypothetical protein